MNINYRCNIFKLNFLFILFLFGCEFNSEKASNFAKKDNSNSIISFFSSSNILKNNKTLHQNQNINTTQSQNLSHDPSTNINNNVQHLKKDTTKTLQKENLNSNNPPQLNQLYPVLSQKKEVKLPQQLISEQKNSQSTKDSNGDSTKSGLIIAKQVKPLAEKKSEINKPLLEERNLISTTSSIPSIPVIELTPKSKEESQLSKPELNVSINNQESFKRYKIQDTLSSSANNAMMYEVSLGIKDGNITNKISDYHFNNNWKLFLARFNNIAIFTITNNYLWGTSFRVGDNNYIKGMPKGISLHLEQNNLSMFKNAMNNTNTSEVFKAQTYDSMENDITVKVNKSYDSDHVFIKFEVNTGFVEYRSDGSNDEEEFDSFDIVKDFLSKQSFAVKKSDFNSFIQIIE